MRESDFFYVAEMYFWYFYSFIQNKSTIGALIDESGDRVNAVLRLTFQAEVEQHILIHRVGLRLDLWSLQRGVDLPGAAVLRVLQFPQAAAHGLGGGGGGHSVAL